MKLTTIVMVGVLSVGCAAKKLAVSNADILVERQITKRLPLTASQKKDLSKDVKTFLKDHKPMAEKAIPVVDEITKVDVENVEIHYDKLLDIYRKISSDFSTLLAQQMVKLGSNQQKDFFENLAEENMQIARRNPKERLDDIYDRFETFFGTITGKQKIIFKENKEYFNKQQGERVNRRSKLHESFKEIYLAEISPEEKVKKIEAAFEQYREAAHNKEKNLEIIKEIIPTLTESQKEKFRKNNKEIKELLRYYLTIDF
jgi:hypothetical protein